MNKLIKVPVVVIPSDRRLRQAIASFKDGPDPDRWIRWQHALNYQTTPKIAPINFAIPDEPYRQ